jgi:SWI/SNF related-matrix-associated actin-dependent regulator of chromatin subfamily C
LDAPDAPAPIGEEDANQEDEEMGGMDDDDKDPDGDKDGEDAVGTEDVGDVSKTAMETAAQHLEEQTYSIVLPSYSSWFDLHVVHPLERKALPEFFNQRNRSKTELVYKEYRNFMINTYRLNPSEYLTVTACRRNLAGDVCAIMRVHAFLEQWGLINYQVSRETCISFITNNQKVDPSHRPSANQPPNVSHFRVVLDTARGLQKFQPGPATQFSQGQQHPDTEKHKKSSAETKTTELLHSRRGIYDDKGKLIKSASVEDTANGTEDSKTKSIEEAAREPRENIYCFSCGQDCKRVFYRRTGGNPPPGVKADYTLCPKCFRDGRHHAQDTNAQFIKDGVENYSRYPDRESAWSDHETYLLLEALTVEDDDWSKIADIVGTRTAEECVQKFLQLEIEDNYIKQVDEEAASANVPHYGRVPISNTENPVMSVISYLVNMTDKSVTLAASSRSVDAMRASLQRRMDEMGDKNKEKDSLKNEDSMEVDANASSSKNEDQTTTSAEKPDAPIDLATLSLATSAARSSSLATHEERQMTTLVSSALNSELEKLELKLKQFTQMESLLQTERLELEKQQQQLFLDRLMFKRRVREVQDSIRKNTVNGAAPVVNISSESGNEKLGFENFVTGRSEDDSLPLGGKQDEDGSAIPSTEGLKVQSI